jgi:hypothetical protein
MECFQYNKSFSIESFQQRRKRMDTPVTRLLDYLKEQKINDNQFTVATGVSVGWIGKMRKKPSSSITEPIYKKIFAGCKNLNETWLKTGSGQMFKTTGLAKAEKLMKDEEDLIKQIEELKKQLKDKDELLEFYRKNKK